MDFVLNDVVVELGYGVLRLQDRSRRYTDFIGEKIGTPKGQSFDKNIG